MLRGLINSEVSSICKPGAKLSNILDSGPTPPSTGTHCEVLIAGTNDLAAGEQHNVYSLLEGYIAARSANSSLVVSTLPHRHDLPAEDDVNQEIALVNAYIEELAVRYSTHILDFNKLDRGAFTRQGMHLTRRGKWRLACLVQQSLGDVPRSTSRAASHPHRSLPASTALPPSLVQPPAAPVQTTASSDLPVSTPPGPFTLPYATYADALTQSSTQHPPSPPQEKNHSIPSMTTIVNDTFLGNPPPSVVPN